MNCGAEGCAEVQEVQRRAGGAGVECGALEWSVPLCKQYVRCRYVTKSSSYPFWKALECWCPLYQPDKEALFTFFLFIALNLNSFLTRFKFFAMSNIPRSPQLFHFPQFPARQWFPLGFFTSFGVSAVMRWLMVLWSYKKDWMVIWIRRQSRRHLPNVS